jgi:Ecdysteroid kinase-like family
LLYSAKEPVPVLVFEDVSMHGYGLSSGLLNVDGTKFVAGKLAKLHASSLHLHHEVSAISWLADFSSILNLAGKRC